tara:strand:+ start:229 stop:471 length:243 start_codon:yes stop_codon:yes gene_type:complete
MSNFQDNPSIGQSKPIHKIVDVLSELNKKLDCMKVDLGGIKSDLDIIKRRIKEKEEQEAAILNNQVKKQEDLARGWFFTY